MTDLQSSYIPTDRQKEAHAHNARYVLYGGAVGGGKSKFLCEEGLALLLEYPGNVGFLGRYSFEDLKKSTLIELESVIAPFYDKIIKKWNKTDKRIDFINGSVLHYGDCQSADKFKSMELGFFLLDEASEIEKVVFDMLCTRLRKKLLDGSYPLFRGLLASNPEPCWLVETFVMSQNPKYAFVPALPRDNPHLPDDYIDTLRESLPEEMAKKYVEGSWDDLGAADCVISISACKSIVGWKPSYGYVKRLVVCDPARFGNDETVIYGMENSRIMDGKEKLLYKRDAVVVAMEIYDMYLDIGANLIVVDADGIGGPIVDILRQKYHLKGKKVIEFHGGSKALESDRFYHLKAEAWFEAEAAIKERRAGLNEDQRLLAQLTSMKYRFQTGRLLTERKDEYKKRVGGSPDRADAYIMGLWGFKHADPILKLSQELDYHEYEEEVEESQFVGAY